MFIESNLPEDPVFRDHVLGWVVFRAAPWRIQGIYSSKERAKEEAREAGDEYQVTLAGQSGNKAPHAAIVGVINMITGTHYTKLAVSHYLNGGNDRAARGNPLTADEMVKAIRSPVKVW
ncbi:hypothetical protein JRK10_001457 [Salmonella enterica]|nr:hypothetical protein [Salmonella enterica]EHD2121999.1 hypothetical protein [Salmonella enterica]